MEVLGVCNPSLFVGYRQHQEIQVAYRTGTTVVNTSRASSPATCLNNGILHMAFGFQDSLSIYGASWQYLVVNLSVFFFLGGGAVRYTVSTYLACDIPQPTT